MSKPKIGLVGGLGPLSTIDYYTGIIDRFHKSFGMDNYPEVVIDSLSLKDFYSFIDDNDPEGLVRWFHSSIDSLRASGATFGAICSNTPHLYQEEIFKGASLQMVSIVDTAIEYILDKGYKKVLVLGTPATMEKGLYDKKMSNSGIVPVIPTEMDIDQIGNIIFPNLENGIIIPEEKQKFIDIIEKYIVEYSVDAVLLGCTELPLLIKPDDIPLPIINTTEIHIDAIFKKYISSIKI